MRRLLSILMLMFCLHASATAQREDTTQFVITRHEDNKQVIADQVYKSFETRAVGMMTFFCEDTVEMSIHFHGSSILTECMQRDKAMDQLRSFFAHIQYVGFREFTGSTVYGPIVFLKVFATQEDVFFIYFLIDPNSMKINKIILE